MLSSSFPFPVFQKSNNFVERTFGDGGAAAGEWKSFSNNMQKRSWRRRILSRRKVPKAATATEHASICDAALRTPDVNVFTSSTGLYLNKNKETSRNVSVEAGRSKAKRKGYSGGRIEGSKAKQKSVRKPAPKNQVIDAKPSVEEDMKHEGTSTQAHSDPRVRYPDEYYKYGPYGPYAWKTEVIGKHRKGTMTDKLVSIYSSVKDEEEHEEMDKYNACVDYDRRLKSFDENVGIKYYYVFVRQTWRIGWQVPWREWTLVSQLAVEYDGELNKWRLGFRLDKRCRDAITKCTAWFRPDLIYIKKPRYQVRFEPQENFIIGLYDLLDPETDWKGDRFECGGLQQTYYGKLCCLLGVPLDADEDDLVFAYEKLEQGCKLACLEHILSGHPVELLHPFSLAWYNKETSNANSKIQAEEEFSGEDVEEEEFINKHDDEDQDEESDFQEESSDNDDEDIELLEKQFNDNTRIVEPGNENSSGDQNHLMDQDCRKEWEQALIGETGSRSWMEPFSEPEEGEHCLEVESEHNKEKVAENKRNVVQVDASELLVKAVVRPFTYVNMIKEIWLIRQMLVNNYRLNQKLLR